MTKYLSPLTHMFGSPHMEWISKSETCSEGYDLLILDNGVLLQRRNSCFFSQHVDSFLLMQPEFLAIDLSSRSFWSVLVLARKSAKEKSFGTHQSLFFYFYYFIFFLLLEVVLYCTGPPRPFLWPTQSVLGCNSFGFIHHQSQHASDCQATVFKITPAWNSPSPKNDQAKQSRTDVILVFPSHQNYSLQIPFLFHPQIWTR